LAAWKQPCYTSLFLNLHLDNTPLPHLFANATELFALADYRRTWAIGAFCGVARWLEFVAIAIFVYELTHSPELVALLVVLRMLPYVLLGFSMGAVADTMDGESLLIASLLIMALVSGGMVLLMLCGFAGYALVAAATMASGAFWTTDMPVRRRLLVDAVSKDRIAAALGLDNSTMYATRALGPLIGGTTYQFLGIDGIYAIITASYLVCTLLAFRLKAESCKAPAPKAAGARFGFLLPPRELIGERRFQIVMGVTLVFNLWCFPFITMVPVIAQKDFGLAPILVGAMSACEGIGGMFGALAVAWLATERTLFQFYYLGTLSFLVIVAALSFHLTAGTAIMALLMLGLASASFSATQYALIYVIAPPEMRGRATGVLVFFIGSSMFGHYHTGLLFERLGSVAAMQVMAIEGITVMAVLGILWWRTKPA
jgi:predicted MFS family arabinose efflux permease